MRFRIITAMSLALSGALPQIAAADSGLKHVLPSLSVANKCTPQAGCLYSWTLASRLGDLLRFTESRYGPRDMRWTLLGVEFGNVPAPQVWYPNFGRGYDSVVIQLTEGAARDEQQALFQLGHEVVHVLSPNGPNASSSVLEEGIATYNSIDYLRASKLKVDTSYINAENYEAAYWAVVELSNAQPDFAARIRSWRANGRGLSGLTRQDMRVMFPAISDALARRLASQF